MTLLLIVASLLTGQPSLPGAGEWSSERTFPERSDTLLLADSTAWDWWRQAVSVRRTNRDWIPGYVWTTEIQDGATTSFGVRLERGDDGGITVTPAGEDASDAPSDGLSFIQSLLGENPATFVFRTDPAPHLDPPVMVEGGSIVEIAYRVVQQDDLWTGMLRLRRSDGVPLTLTSDCEARDAHIDVRYSGSAQSWFPIEVRWIEGDSKRISTLDTYWRP